MKKCSKCGKKKSHESFYKVESRDYYTAACKSCHNKRKKLCKVCRTEFIGSGNQKLCGEKCRKMDRPQTYLRCKACNKEFYADRLNREYCTKKCWYQNIPKRANYTWEYTKKAHSCARKTRYLISKGQLTRPDTCEECGELNARIEAAHYNYDDPRNVRWLCRSCHVRWDQKEPKGGCIKRWEEYSDKKAVKTGQLKKENLGNG